MNKSLERKIIILLILILVMAGLFGCASKPAAQPKQPNVYDGSLGVILGCMVSPIACKENKQKAEQDEITKDFEKVDKDLNSSKK
jgi:hypothetical protein